MKSTRVTALLPLLLCAVINCGGADTPQSFNHGADPRAIGATPGAVARMDALLQSLVDDQKLNCVAGFVAKKGQVVYKKAFGWKDVEKRIPATVDDYYVLFSQTKAVTSVAFMTLVEQGVVEVDDPVSKYFPEISNQVLVKVNEDGSYETRPAKTPLTFAHLLTHTSGLNAGLVRELRRAQKNPNDAPAGFGGTTPTQTPSGQHTGGGDFNAKFLEDEMQALAKYPLGFDPGTKWEYHISSNMLAYLIERISGRPLRDYVKEKVLLPLGMNDTDWFYEPAALGRFVKAYRSVDGKLVAGSNIYSEGTVSTQQTYAEGAIGLNGPIEDYAKFCQMLLNKGEFNGRRILKPETVELMTTLNRLAGAQGAEPGFQFGLGFELHRGRKFTSAMSDSAFSWGGMLGTHYHIDPEHDLVALLYINMYGAEKVHPQFLEHAYGLFSPKDAAVKSATEKNHSPVIVIENGGTGPYSAIATEDPTLPGMTLFRPRNLVPFGDERKLPILLWANGACANTTQEHKNFLNELASHGYVILAIGLLDQIDRRDDKSRQLTRSTQLITALDWALSQNVAESSVFFGKLDTTRVAAMGMSCGGLQVIEISGDPRISTTIVCNSGVLPSPSPLKGMPDLTKDALLKLHAPVLYIMGGPSDIAYNNAMDDFLRVDHVPIVMTNLDVGHRGTYHLPHGGEFTKVALAWLEWQLKDNRENSRMFLGKDSILSRDPNWTIAAKNFPSQ